MIITLDVVFHEDTMYVSSKPGFLGEYHQEIQTLDYEYDNYVKDYSKIDNQEANNYDTILQNSNKGIIVGFEIPLIFSYLKTTKIQSIYKDFRP